MKYNYHEVVIYLPNLQSSFFPLLLKVNIAAMGERVLLKSHSCVCPSRLSIHTDLEGDSHRSSSGGC